MPDNNIPLEELTIYNSSKELYFKIKEKINVEEITKRKLLERFTSVKWKKINIIGKFPINKTFKEHLLNNFRIMLMNKFKKVLM